MMNAAVLLKCEVGWSAVGLSGGGVKLAGVGWSVVGLSGEVLKLAGEVKLAGVVKWAG